MYRLVLDIAHYFDMVVIDKMKFEFQMMMILQSIVHNNHLELISNIDMKMYRYLMRRHTCHCYNTVDSNKVLTMLNNPFRHIQLDNNTDSPMNSTKYMCHYFDKDKFVSNNSHSYMELTFSGNYNSLSIVCQYIESIDLRFRRFHFDN